MCTKKDKGSAALTNFDFFLANPAPARKFLTFFSPTLPRRGKFWLFSRQPYPGEDKIQKFSSPGCFSPHISPTRRVHPGIYPKPSTARLKKWSCVWLQRCRQRRRRRRCRRRRPTSRSSTTSTSRSTLNLVTTLSTPDWQKLWSDLTLTWVELSTIRFSRFLEWKYLDWRSNTKSVERGF